MDYGLSPDQHSLLDAVGTVLRRGAGRARARAMCDAHDDDLLTAMVGAGFLDLATSSEAGPFEAALVVEVAARELAAVNAGARGLVAPHLLDPPLPNRVALADAANPGIVRFGAHADTILVLDGDDVRVIQPAPGEAAPVQTGYVAPYARVGLSGGYVLPNAGADMARWWRVALAAELTGLLDGALQLTTEYLGQRRQFGTVLGSLQALQHRLAECYVWVEGLRWSARSSAWHGDDESAATAATYAAMAARHVAAEMHQLSGAISFTEEYDLQLWTMRAQALRTELGGIGAHAAAVTALRWRQ